MSSKPLTEIKTDQECYLKENINLPDGTVVDVKIQLQDENNNDLAIINDTLTISSKKVSLPIQVENLAKQECVVVKYIERLVVSIDVNHDKIYQETEQTIVAVNNEMDEAWLTVSQGQLTFDSEGNDIDGNLYFSRKPHIPHQSDGTVIGNSGITLGRGLDIGGRSESDVVAIFNQAASQCRKISKELSDWLKDGAGKTKQKAYDYWLTLDANVPADKQNITRKMQHVLFENMYEDYVADTKNLTTKKDVCDAYLGGKQIDWDALPQNVKDVLVDLRYVGVYTGSEDARGNTRAKVIPAVYKDQQEGLSGEGSHFYSVMNDSSLWKDDFGVDPNRFDNRISELE
ncbi:pesticin C-terminus-like muramidase [Vibrio spartinae]|uniref:Pesticin C-terminal domain-containing protein n=1 Tax=Vibrio spartinae TaxID=1918945 RepID=A0ABX6QYX9_9VIBR|nr:pesticin C-terminus-like muramidase [Vibrio spartinae]QMV14185.1 hypothetical protein Vspart_01437 [Vibrio spartinae]